MRLVLRSFIVQFTIKPCDCVPRSSRFRPSKERQKISMEKIFPVRYTLRGEHTRAKDKRETRYFAKETRTKVQNST